MEPLLRVANLAVEFNTLEGIVHAVNGASFGVDTGQRLGSVA